MKDLAIKHLARFEFAHAMRLLHGVLTTYNPDNPYEPLSEFQARTPASAPPGVNVEELCHECERTTTRCSCDSSQTCDECGEDFEDADWHSRCDLCNDCCDCCQYCDSRNRSDCDCCLHCEGECQYVCTDEDCGERHCARPMCQGCDNHEANCECAEEEPPTPT